MKIDQLTPDSKNANKGTARGRAMVRDSLKKYGAGRSILLDKSGNIIAGNKTVEGATALGMEDVQIVKSDGSKLIAVQRTDLDINDKKARELAIADNRAAEIGLEWDPDVLKELEITAEVDLTGFWNDRELVQFLARTTDAPAAKTDEALSLARKWGVEPGQLWFIGDHRILCGDSTKKEDVDRLWANVAKPDPVLMVTDPPYGVDYAALVASRENQKEDGWDGIEGDALTDDQLFELLTGAFQFCTAPVAFVWHPSSKRPIFMRALEAHGWRVAQEIIWVKNALVFGRADYQWRHEPCIYAKRKGARRQDDRTQTTVWEFPKPTNSEHPTQKPVDLFAQSVRNHSERGEICYDPFAGSGTLIAACAQLERRGFGIELETKYVAVALERLSEMGLKPKPGA
jgi:site-specific DNA-methyltransferase (adenine-specific)